MIGAEILPMFEELAKKMQVRSGVEFGRGGKVRANLPRSEREEPGVS